MSANPILPYKYKCQCNKVYDIYGDHPLNCFKNHKGLPHNMITSKFSQALAPLLTTANIILPTLNLDKETHLHLPADPTARSFDVSYKPNCDCHPSNVFSVIGYDITITSATPPPPPNQVLPLSIDCITNTLPTQISLYKTMNRINLTDLTTAEQPLRFQEMTSSVIFSTIK